MLPCRWLSVKHKLTFMLLFIGAVHVALISESRPWSRWLVRPDQDSKQRWKQISCIQVQKTHRHQWTGAHRRSCAASSSSAGMTTTTLSSYLVFMFICAHCTNQSFNVDTAPMLSRQLSVYFLLKKSHTYELLFVRLNWWFYNPSPFFGSLPSLNLLLIIMIISFHCISQEFNKP